MISQAEQDSRTCRTLLAQGSKSFALAGRLLPARLLDDAAAIYAFCREADDVIDDAPSAAQAHLAHAGLERRLSAIARARDTQALRSPVDRALKRVLLAHCLPAGPLAFLLDGFLWDAQGTRYLRLRDTFAYSARVAGSVGVLMARLCGCRAPAILARAADMGVAMQLVNIARDVGEDARRQRVYLPERWLREGGLCVDAWLVDPRPHPAIAQATERLLRWADALFARARLALHALPWHARLAMGAAGRIYQDIGRSLRRSGFDNIDGRAVVGRARKWTLVAQSLLLDGYRPRRQKGRRALGRPALQANSPLVLPWPVRPRSQMTRGTLSRSTPLLPTANTTSPSLRA